MSPIALSGTLALNVTVDPFWLVPNRGGEGGARVQGVRCRAAGLSRGEEVGKVDDFGEGLVAEDADKEGAGRVG